MASCCTGVTECEQLITIGFLNTFIGSYVQNSSGVAQTAAGDSTYCPTYSELTGGTLIQNWEEGTTPNKDKDGIIISGTYANNECVRREDLSMKYTRFKSFSISAASTTLSACSASTTISYTHKYNRCTRKINSTCEAASADSCTEVSDTQNSEVTLTSSNSVFTISNFKVNVPKNNPNGTGRSNSRSTIITGKVTFRGTSHTSQKTITQNGLTGSYYYWYSTGSTSNKRTVCTGSTFGCAGGSYSAKALHTQTDWDVYRYKDVCGTSYDNDTENRNTTSYTVTYDTYNGSFSDKTGQCGTWTDFKSWSGYGDGCSWTQQCATCECVDYIEWGYGTYSGSVPCSGGTVTMRNVTIPGVVHYRHIDSETSACVETSTASTSTTETQTKTFSCNKTSTSQTHTGTIGRINYTITQNTSCCSPGTTYSYGTFTAPCSGGTNISMSVPYTAVTTDSCCGRTTRYGTETGYKIISLDCYSGTSRTVSSSKITPSGCPFTVRQTGSTACCCTCDNSNFNPAVSLDGQSIPAIGYSSSRVIGTYNSSTCLTGITASSNQNWVNIGTVSNGNVNATVQQNADLVNSRNATITVTGHDSTGGTCNGTFIVTQEPSASTCTCSNVDLRAEANAAGNSIPAAGYSSETIIGTYNNSTCLTSIDVTKNQNWVTSIRVNGGNVYAKIDGNTSITDSRTATITVSGNDDYNVTCRDSFVITQEASALTCSCVDGNLSPAVLPAGNSIPASGYTNQTAIGTYNNSTCLTGITASSNQNWVTIGTVSNGNVNATVSDNTSLTDDRNAIITVTGHDSTGGTCNGTFTVTQEPSASTCTCSDLTVTPISGKLPYEGGAATLGTFSDGGCITDISVVSNVPWIYGVSINGSTITGNVAHSIVLEERNGSVTVTGKAGNETCLKVINVTQEASACEVGVFWTISDITIPCDAVPLGNGFKAGQNIFKTTRYLDSEGQCRDTVTPYENPTIYTDDDPHGGIPKNEGQTNVDRSEYGTIYRWTNPQYGYTDFFTNNVGKPDAIYVGTVNITQEPCETPPEPCNCQPGTDNNVDCHCEESGGCNPELGITDCCHPFRLECDDTGDYTSDRYLGEQGEQDVWGRDDGNWKKNVVSSAVTGNTGIVINRDPYTQTAIITTGVAWSSYVEFKTATEMYAHSSYYNNSYGFQSKMSNDLGGNLWVKVEHNLINSDTPAKADTCQTWYSWLEYKACDEYEYTVYSDVEGATVVFASNTSEKIYGSVTTIGSSGTYSASKKIKYNNIKVTISKPGCSFPVNQAVLTDSNTSVRLDGTCGTSTGCLDGGTSWLQETVSSAETSVAVKIGKWEKSPNGCTENWTYDGIISETPFIDTSTITFNSDGYIYGRISSTNNTSSQRNCQIYTRLGNVKTDYFNVYQEAGEPEPVPTTYSYTVVSTNDDAEGAAVHFFDGNNTLITSSTVSNMSCTVILSTDYNHLTAVIQKNGCQDSYATVYTNNSASFTLNCSSVDPCVESPGEPTLSTYTIEGDSSVDVWRYVTAYPGDCYELYGASSTHPTMIHVTIIGNQLSILLDTTDSGSTSVINVHFRNKSTGTEYLRYIYVSWI